MEIREAMTDDLLTLTPGRTLRDAAQAMDERNCGATVIVDPEQPGPGIFTERDLLRAVAANKSLDSETVGDYATSEARFAAGDWSLEQAAEAMISGGFRHLVVVDDGEPVGVVSMRDIVRCWAGTR